MKHIPLLALAAFALAPAAHAQVPNLVTPGDTFTYDVIAYDTNSGEGEYLTNNSTSVFGTTTTYTGDGVNYQNITISSSEVVGVTTTTDTFTISTPTNFITDPTLADGTILNALEFDIGNDISGSDPVNVTLPITSYTATGTALYGTNSTLTLGT